MLFYLISQGNYRNGEYEEAQFTYGFDEAEMQRMYEVTELGAYDSKRLEKWNQVDDSTWRYVGLICEERKEQE